MEEYYYYGRDKDNVPLVTVCLIRQPGVVVRGVSICSPLDSPCKKEGRRIARNKALRAFGRKKSGDKMMRSRAINVMRKVQKIFTYKSYYDPPLTPFEEKILSIGLEKAT